MTHVIFSYLICVIFCFVIFTAILEQACMCMYGLLVLLSGFAGNNRSAKICPPRALYEDC